jgi:hypothetical protein
MEEKPSKAIDSFQVLMQVGLCNKTVRKVILYFAYTFVISSLL